MENTAYKVPKHYVNTLCNTDHFISLVNELALCMICQDCVVEHAIAECRNLSPGDNVMNLMKA